MLKIVALALALSACTSSDCRWIDGTAVAIIVETPAPVKSLRAIRDRLISDMELWNAALVDRGCEAPFRYVDNVWDADTRIVLLPPARWPFKGSVGATFATEINILTQADGTLDAFIDDPMWIVGLHELGHTLGLGHSLYTDSVMQAASQPDTLPLSQRDVDDAVTSIGCHEGK